MAERVPQPVMITAATDTRVDPDTPADLGRSRSLTVLLVAGAEAGRGQSAADGRLVWAGRRRLHATHVGATKGTGHVLAALGL
ncbi:hypothetical protein [Kitasatospora sp. NPDC059599]|uniref:hypothetical protein n=1 Tax=Kitasatospora sp. NPDC059599 TaxID=3346880 RepID=UPI003680512D